MEKKNTVQMLYTQFWGFALSAKDSSLSSPCCVWYLAQEDISVRMPREYECSTGQRGIGTADLALQRAHCTWGWMLPLTETVAVLGHLSSLAG